MKFIRVLPILVIAVAVWSLGSDSSVAGASQPVSKEMRAVEHEAGAIVAEELAEATGQEEGVGEPPPSANPLAFQTDLAIWTAVVFVILLAFLWKFAWGPICDGLEKREQGIVNEVEAAKEGQP